MRVRYIAVCEVVQGAVVAPFVTRREMLVSVGASSVASTLPGLGCGSTPAPASSMPPIQKAVTPYFTTEERSVLGALADAVLPPDDVPGGNALGAVDYIERLLTAFEEDTPFVYAGGPYSGVRRLRLL